MAKYELKTQKSDSDVYEFIDSVIDEQKRQFYVNDWAI